MRLMVAVVNNYQNDPTCRANSPVNVQQYLDVAGCDYRTLDHRSLGASSTLDGFHCVILSGTHEPTWVEPSPYAGEEAFVRRCNLPILGICGGLQIIARAWGATLAPLAAPIYGRTRVERVGDSPLLAGLPPVFVAFTKHRYVVEDVPSEFRLTARSESNGSVYAMEHSSLPIYGVQFHPERRNDGKAALDNFIKVARRIMRSKVNG